MTRRRPRSRLLAFAIMLPVLAMLLAATAVAAPSKPVFVDISPLVSNDITIAADDVAKGTCVTFKVTITNNNKTQQMGSANFTLDNTLIYDAAGCLLDETVTSATGSADANGLVIELRDLNTGPGGSVTFTFNASIPCTAGTTSVTYGGFSAIVKQANNYSGDPGNNLTVASDSDFDVQSVGLCQAFDGSTKPSGSIAGSNGAIYSLDVLNATAGTLILAKGVNSIACNDYTEHTDTVTLDFTADAAKILTFKFPNSTHEQKSAFRVCFASPDAWTDRSGTSITNPATASLLPDCNSTTAPTNLPCMLPVTIQGQQVTIKAWLRPGDPPGRG